MTKRILITGATGAIGAMVCEYLARKGHQLILAARDIHKLDLLSARLQKEYGANIVFSACDFNDVNSFSNLIKTVDHGLDGLIIMPPPAPETSDCLPQDKVWESLFKTSFIGPVALIRNLIPALKMKSGATVVISGISSKQPLSKYATSNVLRTAWLGQVKTMADVYGEFGLRFNALSLGGVMTEKLITKIKNENSTTEAAALPETLAAAFKQRFSNIPLRRYAEVQEIAEMIDFMLNSAASRHLTGQNMALDGGFTRAY